MVPSEMKLLDMLSNNDVTFLYRRTSEIMNGRQNSAKHSLTMWLRPTKRILMGIGQSISSVPLPISDGKALWTDKGIGPH